MKADIQTTFYFASGVNVSVLDVTSSREGGVQTPLTKLWNA
jgi:hypothetical protein